MKDSYGAWGLMGGILYQPVQRQAVGLKFAFGAAAGIWWRTNGQDKLTLSSQPAWLCKLDHGTTCYYDRYMMWTTELHRETVPFVIPTLSVKGEHWGANLSVIPKLQIGDSQVVPANTWILQITYSL